MSDAEIDAALAKATLKAERRNKQAEKADQSDDDSSDSFGEEGEKMSTQAIRRVTHLRRIQLDQDQLRLEYTKERIELEKKYELMYQPGYQLRHDIINGLKKPELTNEEEEGLPKDAPEDEEDNGIEGFWFQAMSQLEEIAEFIEEEDVPLMSCITDITCTYNDDYKKFTLSFTFKENDFIKNKILTKTYTINPNILTEEPPSIDDVEFTPIEWKDEKSLLNATIKKKQKAKSGKNKGQTRTITKVVEKQSFFRFFGKPEIDDESDSESDEDDEGGRNGEEKFGFSGDADWEVANAIRVSVIPEAIFWFTGENVEEGDYDEDDEDDEDEDEDDDDDDDEDEEEMKPTKGGKGKKSKGGKIAGNAQSGFAFQQPEGGGDAGAKGGKADPECKQN